MRIILTQTSFDTFENRAFKTVCAKFLEMAKIDFYKSFNIFFDSNSTTCTKGRSYRAAFRRKSLLWETNPFLTRVK